MRRLIVGLLFGLCSASMSYAQVPSSLGWHQLASTTIRSVCPSAATYPDIQGVEGCEAVTADWAGGAFDPVNNRMLMSGGGHAGYAGNEVYALNLGNGSSNPTIERLNEPTATVRDGCVNDGTYSDGKPVARHTYNNLAYLPSINAMFMFGGSLWQCGSMWNDAWLFNLTTEVWTEQSNTNGPSGNSTRACVTDPSTELVYCRDDFNLRSFNHRTNTWTNRSASNASNDYKAAVIDTTRKRYWYWATDSSTTLFYYDISSPTSTGLTRNSVSPSGCTWLNDGLTGADYDPVQDRIVTWDGGNSVQLYNPDTNSCSTVTHTGGPTAMANGTLGRFQYSPKLNLFVVCNDIDSDCYALRLTAALSAADTDFQNRCHAAGVIKCVDFNTTGDYLTGNYAGVPGIVAGTSTTATRDTGTYASGGGAARFTIASGSGPGGAGWYATPFNYNFLAGETFYVQFRQRVDTNMLTADFGGGGWKQSIFHNRTAGTCANLEITTNNNFYRGFPIIYTNCGSGLTEYNAGADGFILEYSQPYPSGSAGTVGVDYYCRHQLLPATTRCATYTADAWMTYTYQITLGTFGAANSTIKGWVGYGDGQPSKLFINQTNHTIFQDSAGLGFDYVTLLPYDTGKNGQAHTQAQTWYDELIVSTQPIADPGQAATISGRMGGTFRIQGGVRY